MNAAPVDARYIAGLWHRQRVNPVGIAHEIRAHTRCLLSRSNPGVSKKFLILGRARSGTSLLSVLLNSHPTITCDGEVLNRVAIDPVRFLDCLSRQSPTTVFGAKLLSYQMVQVHRLKNPIRFLERLEVRGFQFIHVVRNTWDQTMSLTRAQTTGKYHSFQSPERRPSKISSSEFIERLEWSEVLLDYERFCLRGFPHFKVSYEDDLGQAQKQQATSDRIFDWLEIPSAEVSSSLSKVSNFDPGDMIEGLDEARAFAARKGILNPS
ncbi:MAG: hypothetical protein AAF498_08735 [Pseudomonadota bacterium]